jgi:hypothetical protein
MLAQALGYPGLGLVEVVDREVQVGTAAARSG